MPTKPIFLPGSLQIGCPQGDGCDYFTLEVTDESSHVQFIEIKVSYADMALAMTARRVDCQFNLRGVKLVGSKAEHKMVVVPFKDRYVEDKDRKAVAVKALAPFEVDGWEGDVSDLFNPHRHTDSGQFVSFRRHIDASGQPIP